MSAPDRALLEMLLAAEDVSPSEKALQNLITIMRNAATRLESHEIRYYEIALEGLGMPSNKRRNEVQEIIQIKRDWLTARRAQLEANREAP